MVFHKILVAIDRSSQSAAVFAKALELAQQHHSSLLLISAVQIPAEVLTAPFLGIGTIADVNTYSSLKRLQQEQVQTSVRQAERWLREYVAAATAKGIPIEVRCDAQRPGEWICGQAKAWNSDLIVLGRRGHRGLSEVLLGSVSSYVLHHAPCAVLVVQGQEASVPAAIE